MSGHSENSLHEMVKNNSAQIYPDNKDSHGSSDVRIYKNGSWVAAPFRVRKFTQTNSSTSPFDFAQDFAAVRIPHYRLRTRACG